MPDPSELDWSEIIEKHSPLVWNTASRLLSHEADAADCFQETFVAALKAAARERIENWPGFLKTIATATSLNRLRERYRQPRRNLTEVPAPCTNPAGLATEMDPTELADELRQALAELDPRQAEVFCLVCLEGASYADVARHMDISENNVGVILARARQRLRERLKAFAPHPNRTAPARTMESESR
jgi:RNA polymerase sigma-70 factor (ECF subfamily)